MKRVLHIGLALVLCIALTIPVFALEGVWHNPYGINDLYEAQPTERYPRDPAAGDVVYIKGTTWPVEFGQSVWISYTINGKSEQNIGAEWKYNDGNNSYWEAKMGPFAQGDVVEYVVHADKDGQNAQAVGPFSFNVTAWEQAKSVNLASESGGVITLDVTPDKGSFSPKLGLSFPSENILRFQFSPKGDTPFEPGRSNYTVTESGNRIVISTSALRVTITKPPYGIEVYDIKNGKTLTQNGGTGNELSWLTDGNDVIKSFREGFASPSNEQFYGFGERYNGIEKRGEAVDIYVFNQYQNQGEKSYLAVPYFYSNCGYGLYLNSTYYSHFDMAKTNAGQYFFMKDEIDLSACDCFSAVKSCD